ncbi:hypothetical protein FA95DRAFT_1539466 [Auriscalpium vulgare]|uniref:Uncharacterized protein n=1 Tax=Auriscalpium vulgare TaxID=40419 RepID=A0ACB8RX05_9AGAM|nr:hypothetical protein FA95DRAFT_1539466 [Auriscalpium vulgare]
MTADDEEQQHIDKGKGRASTPEPTEDTPLLASSSHTLLDDDFPHPTRRHLVSTLTTVFLATLALSIVVILGLVFLAYSYAAKASRVSSNELLDKAVVFRGPDSVDVLNITDAGEVWVRLDGRVGVDAGAVIDVNPDVDDNIWDNMWKSIGRWGVRKLDGVSVNISSIAVHAQTDAGTLLASVWVPPIELPLTTDPPRDLSWLTNVSVPICIRPSQNTSAWIDFARESWRRGYVATTAEVAQAVVAGGPWGKGGWRSQLKLERGNLHVPLRMKIPSLPGLPSPGHDLPEVADLIHLQDFGISSDSHTLSLAASVTFINPIPPNIRFTAPAFPFIVWIPLASNGSSVPFPIASVFSAPFSLTHPNISLALNGTVLPVSGASAPALSTLISHYLAAEDAPISITSPRFPGVDVDTVFPAPHPKPEIMRNVTIHDMKIRPVGQAILASGTVFARVVLPPGVDVGLAVSRVLPDVLIFDGELDAVANLQALVQGGVGAPAPPPPLPDPLPERAFAHIRPDDWLDATSEPGEPEDGEGVVALVSARIVDVPLEVLPGRQREFSNFVGKVIFGKEGALAGVQGITAVTVHVDGLPIGKGNDDESGMDLSGLPFQGSVRIGKRGL